MKREIILNYLKNNYYKSINNFSDKDLESLLSTLDNLLPDSIIDDDQVFSQYDKTISYEIIFLEFAIQKQKDEENKTSSVDESFARKRNDRRVERYESQVSHVSKETTVENGEEVSTGYRRRNDRRVKEYGKHMNNTTEETKQPNVVRKELIPRKVKSTILALAIIASLTSLGNVTSKHIGKQLLNAPIGGYKFPTINSKIYNQGANVLQEKLDGLVIDLDKITNIDDRIKPIYSFYEIFYESENQSYRYIGFYETYESIKGYMINKEYKIDNILKIMDTVLQKTVDYTYEGSIFNDVANSCYSELNNYSCFLDFVSDRVNKITGNDTSKYDAAISEYLSLGRTDKYEEMSEESKKAIEELLKIYEKEYRELCKIFIVDHYDVFDVVTFKGGKKI